MSSILADVIHPTLMLNPGWLVQLIYYLGLLDVRGELTAHNQTLVRVYNFYHCNVFTKYILILIYCVGQTFYK